MNTPSWNELAGKHCSEIEEVLLPVSDFDAALKILTGHPDSPCSSIYFEVRMQAPFGNFELGKRGDGEPSYAQTFSEIDPFKSSVRISTWNTPGATSTATDVIARLQKLFSAYWKGQMRSSVSWLISKDNSERANLISRTLSSRQDRTATAFIYCDLDNFKSANDQLGHEEGDRIIREFGSIVVKAASHDGIPLHRSGDEFLIIASCATVHDPLSQARNLHRLLGSHDFKTGSIKIGAKVGISMFDGGGSYAQVATRAEFATTVNGEKQRGRARFALGEAIQNRQLGEAQALDTALVLLRSGIGSEEPFANPWLNFISSAIRNDCGVSPTSKSIRAAADDCIAWIQPSLRPELLTASQFGGPVAQQPEFSNVDIAFAVAHATLWLFARVGRTGTLKLFTAPDGAAGRLLVDPGDNEDLFEWGVPAEVPEYNLGCIPNWSAPVAPEAYKRAMLVKIGHGPLPVPERAFSEVIVVDDRPTRGGGLPDFWESAVARLVTRCDSNPNVAAVFVHGDEANARLTWNKVNGMDAWQSSLDDLSARTGVDRGAIDRVARRLGSSTFCPKDEREFIRQLAEVYRRDVSISPVTHAETFTDYRFLVRRLDSRGFDLGRDDGCRTGTIAQAYPLVLEIVRKATMTSRIVDQAGQELRELVDFKVHLEQPSLETLPAFFQKESASLDAYFADQFLSPRGLFGRYLRNGQEDAVVDHVVASLSDPHRPFQTRRAVLVIPHAIEPDKDLAPLGLISLRIIPRALGTRRIINFSFTWRTVEAIIGFPYSLYGSVRYSQHLTGMIRERLAGSAEHIEMGFVSYIAHSLHLFVDQYAQNIARRIVEDASE